MRTERIGSFAIVLLLLGIVLLRGSATGFSVDSFAPALPSSGCTDGDLGLSPSIASAATSEGVELRDQCYDGGSLFEAVCDGGKATYVLVNCAYEVSSESSCVQEGRNSRCS